MDTLDTKKAVGKMTRPVSRWYPDKIPGRGTTVLETDSESVWYNNHIEVIEPTPPNVPCPWITFEDSQAGSKEYNLARTNRKAKGLAWILARRGLRPEDLTNLRKQYTRQRKIKVQTGTERIALPRHDIRIDVASSKAWAQLPMSEIWSRIIADHRAHGRNRQANSLQSKLDDLLLAIAHGYEEPTGSFDLANARVYRVVVHRGDWGEFDVPVYKRKTVRFLDQEAYLRALSRLVAARGPKLAQAEAELAMARAQLEEARVAYFGQQHQALQVGTSDILPEASTRRVPLFATTETYGSSAQQHVATIDGLPHVGNIGVTLRVFTIHGEVTSDAVDACWQLLPQRVFPSGTPNVWENYYEEMASIFFELLGEVLGDDWESYDIDDVSYDTVWALCSEVRTRFSGRIYIDAESDPQQITVKPLPGFDDVVYAGRAFSAPMHQSFHGYQLEQRIDGRYLYGGLTRDGFIAEFSDKREMRVSALESLNLKDDEKSFNIVRSLGELKDLPQSWSQGSAFWEWSLAARGRDVIQLRKRSGGLTYMRPADFEEVVRRCNGRKQVALGTLKASSSRLIRLSARSSIGALAGAYLAWQFAIKPTIGDVATVVKQGWDWCWQTYRGLSQVVAAIRKIRSKYLTFRRGWSVLGPQVTFKRGFLTGRKTSRGAFWRRKSWNLVAIPGYRAQKDPAPVLTFRCSDRLELANHALLSMTADPKSICMGGYSSRLRHTIEVHAETRKAFVPYLSFSTSNDYKIIVPSALTSRCLDYLDSIGYRASEQFNKVLIDNNRLVLATVFGWQTSIVPVYRAVGKAWARFGLKAVIDALYSRWNNVLAKTNAIMTAWELAPLSFVVDWFANTQARVTVANNKAIGLKTPKPISGSLWESEEEQLYVGRYNPVATDPNISAYLDPGLSGPVSVVGVVSGRNYGVNYVICKVAHDIVLQVETHPLHHVKQLTCLFSQGMRKYYRRVASAVKLPRLRLRINLQLGKFGTLVAMLASGKRSK